MAERASGVRGAASVHPADVGAEGSAEEQLFAELRAARSAGRRRPDFFIVGHAKCGTTALHQMLCSHPQIYMPAIKETQFLSRAPHFRSRHRRPVRPQTLERYLSLFDGVAPDVRAGEASTEYLRTPSTASRIAQLCPDARIIALFREPTSFLRSLHLQLLEVGNESERDFARALSLEPERRQGRQIPAASSWPAALLYSDHVRYVHQLREYHEHFGRDRVLVIIYDDFRRDNDAVLRQVLRFLDVEDSLELDLGEANPTVRVRSQRLLDTVNALSVGRTPGARAAKGEVVAASEYLERDLVQLWGYDELG